MKQALSDFCKNESGLTVVEYVVAAGLIASALIGLFTALGDAQTQKMDQLIR